MVTSITLSFMVSLTPLPPHHYMCLRRVLSIVGLQAEEAKPVVDGAGLCPGYTISRAILADAISLTRGDRFYTTDMTPHNYTAWGLRDCARDTSNPGFGSMLGRLFLRTLPMHYTSNSTYTWFPLMTPQAMEKYTAELGVKDRYNFERPTPAPVTHIINNYPDVAGMMKDVAAFRPPYADRVGAVVKGQGYGHPLRKKLMRGF